jgi:hypothetical protein
MGELPGRKRLIARQPGPFPACSLILVSAWQIWAVQVLYDL